MAQPEVPTLEGHTVPLKGIRRTAARQMVSAWEAPAFHLSIEVDMTEALKTKALSPGSTVSDVILLASSRALAKNPSLNAHYSEDGVTRFADINIGIAVATEAGLTVPVIHHVDRREISSIAEARREVVQRARARRLALADVSAGTFTISNLGMLGIDRFDAILNVPQVAILAIGSTFQRFVMTGSGPDWRPIASMTLTCDHRAVDGAEGAAFLEAFKGELQAPLSS